MNRGFVLAVLSSALLHLMAYWLLRDSHENVKEKLQPIMVEFLPPPVKAPKAGSSRRAKKAIPLSALIPKLKFEPSEQPSEENFAEPQPTWVESRAYDKVGLFEGGGLTVGEVTFLGSLWRMIDQYIEENVFLSEYSRTGQVFLRFEVDEKGRLENRTFQASAADRVLKVIAARAVRKALKNETGDVRLPNKHMVVHARFTWSGYQACSSLRAVRGTFLSFCHYGENKRKSFSKSEKLGTYAKAIINHGPWAVEEIQKYNREQSRRRSQFDPFEEYKRDPDWNL